jgi:hypothetical protein
MERRIRPIHHPTHITMLDRVVVDIIHRALITIVVPDSALPKSLLPEHILAPRIFWVMWKSGFRLQFGFVDTPPYRQLNPDPAALYPGYSLRAQLKPDRERLDLR